MKNKCKVIGFPLYYENTQKVVSEEEFYTELYKFLQKIDIVNNKKEFFDFVYINKIDIKRFVKGYNLFDI